MSKESSRPLNLDSSDRPSCFSDTHNLILTTTNDVPGHRFVRILGTVYGLTVRSRNWGVDIGATLRSAIGGELRPYTNMLYMARDAATERMMGKCMGRGGKAVVTMRYDASEMKIFSQVCAYGTAVVLERI